MIIKKFFIGFLVLCCSFGITVMIFAGIILGTTGSGWLTSRLPF